MQINYLCTSYVLFVDIFTRSFDDFISMKFLIAVFLPASPYINFGDFWQPPRLIFWLKFASLPVYSALPFYLKLENNIIDRFLTFKLLFLGKSTSAKLKFFGSNSSIESFFCLSRNFVWILISNSNSSIPHTKKCIPKRYSTWFVDWNIPNK